MTWAVLRAYQEGESVPQVQETARARSFPHAKNRGRIDVVADVLSACSSPVGKNVVLIRANVNSVTATYVLAQLMDSHLLDTVVDEEGRVAYISTKQGAAFLTAYRGLTTMLTSSLVPETRAEKPEIGLFA